MSNLLGNHIVGFPTRRLKCQSLVRTSAVYRNANPDINSHEVQENWLFPNKVTDASVVQKLSHSPRKPGSRVRSLSDETLHLSSSVRRTIAVSGLANPISTNHKGISAAGVVTCSGPKQSQMRVHCPKLSKTVHTTCISISTFSLLPKDLPFYILYHYIQ